MKKILLFVLSLWSIGLQAQNTESDNKTLIDFIRNSGLTPARVANALDAINYSKVSIVGIYTASGTNTYAVTVGTGITNNDANKQLIIKFTNANTSSTVTLNVNGIGALPLKTNLNADPDVGGIPAGSIYLIGSTGTTWRMIGPTNEGGVAVTNWGDIPTGNLDDQTDLYDTLNTKARKVYKIKSIASNYTAALGDHDNKLIIVNGGADFKIPKDADVDFPLGATLLAVDTLGTATFSADPLVTIDSTDQSQVWTKVAANKWTNFKSNSGSSSGAYWPLAGPATLTGDVDIDGDGNQFQVYNAGDVGLGAQDGYNVVLSAGNTSGHTSRISLQADSTIHISSVKDTITFQGTDIKFQTSNTFPDAVDRYTIDADGLHSFNGIELTAVMTNSGNTGQFLMYPGISNSLSSSATSGNTYSSTITNAFNYSQFTSVNSTDDSEITLTVIETGNPNDGAVRVSSSVGGVGAVRFEIQQYGDVFFENTVTVGGTTGNQTINKASGTVNFAAAATSLTVTNSQCSTSSIVFAVIRTNDATAVLGPVVPNAGNFVINMKTAPTSETSVGFFIIN